ncbi:MAG: FAD:protein FMN transferase [Rhodobacteraceae bacterium]|nr:FAD:protein FMN transferase [Paracoccaceae bacterium]
MADTLALTRRTVLFLPLVLAACKPGGTIHRLRGETMGTAYSVVALDPAGAVRATHLQNAIDEALADVNAAMSNWDSDSEISRFNAARTTEPVEISPALAHVMLGARDVHSRCHGCLDVTVGPLIDAWGFGSGDGKGTMPDALAIAAARRITGQDKLRVRPETLQKTVPETAVYLSAIGKGYGVDRVARAVASLGITDFMVDIGGDLYTRGKNAAGIPWQIGIERPDALDRRVQRVVGVSGRGMATSGDYRTYFERDGVRYSHIIDPDTGHPITHSTASATVLAENAMLADAWATALLTLGSGRGMAVARAQNLAVIFVDRTDGDFVISESPAFTELGA